MAIREVIVGSAPVSDPDRAKTFHHDARGVALLRDDAAAPGLRWLQAAPKAGKTSLTVVA